MSKTIEFEGVPSGDYESFCWDVSKDTFERVEGYEPTELDKSFFNEGMYRLYPNVIFESNKRLKIKINVEEITSMVKAK